MECMITSRQNPRVKAVCALSEKKERERSGLFRMDGIKLLEEAIAHGVCLTEIYIRQSSYDTVWKRLGADMVPLEDRILTVSDSVFEKMTEEKSPEGVLAVGKQLMEKHRLLDVVKDLRDGERIFFLESIRDPGNLGTIIRTAAALGINRLILSDDCADLYHPRTIRAAMGGLFRQRIDRVRADGLKESILEAKHSGRRVFATALGADARTLGEESLLASDCFVIGNEGHGLQEQTVRACGECMLIPMTEGSESFNAAVAAAICMWEIAKA